MRTARFSPVRSWRAVPTASVPPSPSDRRLRRRACVNYCNSADRARGVVDPIETAEGRAIAVRADVRDVDAIQRVTDQTATAFGGAFSRLWLGVRSDPSRSWADGLSTSPDLLAEHGRVPCLPSPASDGDYWPPLTQSIFRWGFDKKTLPVSVTRTSSSRLTPPNPSVGTCNSRVKTLPSSTVRSTARP